MQQLHTITEPQNEPTLSYAPAEVVTPPEQALTQMELQQEV